MGSKLNSLKKVGKAIFTKNPAGGIQKDAMTLFNLPYSLNKGAQFALTGGVMLATGAVATTKVANSGKLGDITAGGIADMTQSVKPSAQVQKVIKKGKLSRGNPISTNGATGDIIFALHNMR